jgi:endogenous inhibitor of DNA gyrase (YacG/DUF329 family)
MILWNVLKMDEEKLIKEEGELFPFICDRCKGFYDCEFTINGICQCPECDKDVINV